MKSSKLFCIIMAAIMIITLLPACASSPDAAPSASSEETSAESPSAEVSKPADSGQREKLTMWFWGTPEDYRPVLKAELADKFAALQEDYELVIEYRNSVNKDIAVALNANEGPDIVYESSPSLAVNFAEAGKVISLNSYAEEYGWKDKMIPFMYDSSSVKGNLISIPMGLNVIGMFYNQKVLDDNNWPVPNTLDELITVMEAAKAKGMYASVTGNKGWKPTNEDYTSLFLNAFAGPVPIYEALSNKAPFDTPEMQFAVETSAEWYKNGYLGGEDYVNLDWGESAQLLADGQAPFFFGPTKFFQFAAPFFKDQPDSLRFKAFPEGKPGIGEVYAVGATGILMINANSEKAKQDAAAQVLNIILTPEFAAGMAKSWPGYWGVPLKDLNIDVSTLSGPSKYFVEATMEAAKAITDGHFGYYASSYFPPETFDILAVNIDTVWFDQDTPEGILQKADKAFAEEFPKDLVPPLPVPAGQ